MLVVFYCLYENPLIFSCSSCVASLGKLTLIVHRFSHGNIPAFHQDIYFLQFQYRLGFTWFHLKSKKHKFIILFLTDQRVVRMLAVACLLLSVLNESAKHEFQTGFHCSSKSFCSKRRPAKMIGICCVW